MLIQHNIGWATYLSGRPQEAIDKHLLPVLQSDWAKSITDDSREDELHVLMVAHDNAASAYGVLKNFTAMLPHIREALRICELLARRLPANVFYRDFATQYRAWYGYALAGTGQVGVGLAAIKETREAMDARAKLEPPNQASRRNQMIIAAVQALAFARWSGDASASFAERRERLARAEASLADAEELDRSVRAKSGVLPVARVELPAARTKLEADERAKAKP